MTPAFGQNEPEFGFCPFLGASYPVSASSITAPGGGVTGSVTVQGACMGPKCRLWNGADQDCTLKSLFAVPDLASLAQGFERALIAVAHELALIRQLRAIEVGVLLVVHADKVPAPLLKKYSEALERIID